MTPHPSEKHPRTAAAVKVVNMATPQVSDHGLGESMPTRGFLSQCSEVARNDNVDRVVFAAVDAAPDLASQRLLQVMATPGRGVLGTTREHRQGFGDSRVRAPYWLNP